jgi:hypothetical protein
MDSNKEPTRMPMLGDTVSKFDNKLEDSYGKCKQCAKDNADTKCQKFAQALANQTLCSVCNHKRVFHELITENSQSSTNNKQRYKKKKKQSK